VAALRRMGMNVAMVHIDQLSRLTVGYGRSNGHRITRRQRCWNRQNYRLGRRLPARQKGTHRTNASARRHYRNGLSELWLSLILGRRWYQRFSCISLCHGRHRAEFRHRCRHGSCGYCPYASDIRAIGCSCFFTSCEDYLSTDPVQLVLGGRI
jgi:hypothetical protein